MSYVLKCLDDGEYLSGRCLSGTSDLQEARVYRRVVDAKNSVGAADFDDRFELVEVVITEKAGEGD